MTGAAEARVHFVVPDGIDDPERVSGGNVYDRRIRDELRVRGLEVRMMLVAEREASEAARAMSLIPDDSLVLVDGLTAAAAVGAMEAHSRRLRIVVLAHMVASGMPGAGAGTAERERAALMAARRVIVTSDWTRSQLVSRGLVAPELVVVAHPGTDLAPAAAGSGSGERLLCVGAVAVHKGQDLLVRALSGLAELSGWSCAIVGSQTVEPDFVARTSAAICSAGLEDRIELTGVLTGRRLGDAYAAADLVVAPSRAESYGMVVAEALARGIPVVAARVGGIPEAIAGRRAGILVPPDDARALRRELQRWCEDAARRAELKAEALGSRTETPGWAVTAATIASVLDDCRSAG